MLARDGTFGPCLALGEQDLVTALPLECPLSCTHSQPRPQLARRPRFCPSRSSAYRTTLRGRPAAPGRSSHAPHMRHKTRPQKCSDSAPVVSEKRDAGRRCARHRPRLCQSFAAVLHHKYRCSAALNERGLRLRFSPPPPDCSDRTCSEPTGLADHPRRALLFCLEPSSTYDLGDILPCHCSRDASYPIFPTSGPRIAASFSVSLNLRDFAHLVHKISVVTAQGLMTSALAAVRFPLGVGRASSQTHGRDWDGPQVP